MFSNRIMGPAHDVLSLDDTKAVFEQETTLGNRGSRKMPEDQTDKDQSEGMAVARQEGIKWRAPLAIFESVKEPGMFAITSDMTGGNLPTCYAPWRNLNPGDSKRFAQKGPDISLSVVRGLLKAVQVDGYCLACTRSTFSRSGQELSPVNELD